MYMHRSNMMGKYNNNNLIILDKKDHIETEWSYVNDYTHKI